MIDAADPRSPRGRLESHGYAFGPSRYRFCLHVTLNGRPVGDLDAGEIGALDRALVSGQHDAHCAVPRRAAGLALLAAMDAAIDHVARG